MRGVRRAVGAAGLAVLVAACGGSPEARQEPAVTDAGTTAITVRARQIIERSVAGARGPAGDPVADLRRRGLVTPALVRQAEQASPGGGPGGYDLLTCSQNPLPDYDLGIPEIAGARGEVDVTGVYATGPLVFTNTFVATADGWRLDHVACPGP